MKKTIINIDGEICVGCGACVSRCAQDALRMVDGRAVLVNDNYCDGLGNCIGECPVGAITLTEREVGSRVGVGLSLEGVSGLGGSGLGGSGSSGSGVSACPSLSCSSLVMGSGFSSGSGSSELRQFPVQLGLVTPRPELFGGAELLLAADCVAYACGDFHSRWLRGRKLAIACPKLDANVQSYVEKLTRMIDEAGIASLTVVVMEVPCCGGLVRIARMARERAVKSVPMRVVTVSVEGKEISVEES
ncbi:MAG: 4Fe-4S binding protein [Alistipes sp.]|nr:4Fe-4S binding protein [Alistipes sp.]